MCGICGILYYDKNAFVDACLIKKMTNTLTSRGPDDEGIYVKNNIGMGVRRLAIIDIEGGGQPVTNEKGTLRASLNGEIYNYKEIKKHSLRTRHEFRSNSDTEVIPHLYEDFGCEFVKHLNGMFSITLWDEPEKTLYLYRDRLGIKPLYYYSDSDVFVWASEIKAILASGLVEREIDARAVDLYFRFGYVPAPYSIFKGIEKLMPGHYIRAKDRKIAIQTYWNVELKDFNKSKYVEDELYDLLKQSIKYRLISDVPLGAFLSGGLDSSFIVGLMQALSENAVETFSISFADRRYDESLYARRVASLLGTNHFECEVEPDPEEILSKILPYFDEPFADKSAIPAYYVSKMARQRVTVALSGDGGDELFGGYTKYRTLKAAGIYHRLSPAASSLLNVASHFPSKMGCRLKRARFYGEMEPWERFIRCAEIMSDENRNAVLNRETIPVTRDEEMTNLHRLSGSLWRAHSIDEEINNWLLADIKTYLVDDVLTKVDRMSMCHSLEVRVPFLDHRVVEYLFTLPGGLKLHHFNGKFLLKRLARHLLPKDIIYRKKHAWLVPLRSWFENELNHCLNDNLFSPPPVVEDILNVPQLQRYAIEHRKRLADHSTTLWNTLSFIIWAICWVREEDKC